MKVTRLVEKASYDKLVNELLMKVTRLVETAPHTVIRDRGCKVPPAVQRSKTQIRRVLE